MSQEEKPFNVELIQTTQLCNELGVTEHVLNRWIELGTFPKPLRMGLRRRVWWKVTVREHIERLAAEAAQEDKENEISA